MNQHAKSDYIIGCTVPTLIWGRESEKFHTRVSLFNYYSVLNEKESISSQAYVYLFLENGTPAGRYEKMLRPLEQWQFELSSAIPTFQGTIAVQLIPNSMPSLKHDRYVGTLFFATYWDDQGHCDFTHETDRMRFETDRKLQYEPAVIPTSPDIEMSVIVQNSFFGHNVKKSDGRWSLEIRDHAGTVLVNHEGTLAPQASKVLAIQDLLPDYRKSLGGRPGSVHVKGRHINQPLTFMRHISGDFNIHHF
jgi:hypothetical protein